MKFIDGPRPPKITAAHKEAATKPENTVKKGYVSWEIKSHTKQEKNLVWYILFGFAITLVSAYFAWTKDWFPLGIVVVSSGLFLWSQTRQPNEEKSRLEFNRLGIKIDEHFYPFEELHSFWMNFNPKNTILNIMLVKKYLPAIQLDITNTDPYLIKQILTKKIPEQEKRTENMIDALVRILKL